MNEKPEFVENEFKTETFKKKPPPADDSGVQLKDFVEYMQSHDYIYLPAGDFWPAARVNARIPPVSPPGKKKTVKASVWLAKNAPVEQMTWAPGLPQLIGDRLVSDGGWVERTGVTVLNLYRPPRPLQGDPAKAEPWVKHVRQIYPD